MLKFSDMLPVLLHPFNVKPSWQLLTIKRFIVWHASVKCAQDYFKKKERKIKKERKKSLFKGWSVQLSHSFMSNSLLSHEPQQARPPCPSVSPKPMSIESVIPSIHLILWHPLLLLPSIVSSNKMLSNEPALHIRLPKYWSFSFNISPSNEH